jgi:hypothetical protein
MTASAPRAGIGQLSNGGTPAAPSAKKAAKHALTTTNGEVRIWL